MQNCQCIIKSKYSRSKSNIKVQNFTILPESIFHSNKLNSNWTRPDTWILFLPFTLSILMSLTSYILKKLIIQLLQQEGEREFEPWLSS